MRRTLMALALLVAASGASAQSVAELRAQLQETQALIAQAEAAGMDESMLASLRENMAIAEQTISEMEAEQYGSGAELYSAPEASYSTRPNALDGDPACGEFTLANYRELGLAGG